MALTSIQISNKLRDELKERKLFDNESYEEVIWDLLEDTMELSTEAKNAIKEAESDIKKGKLHSIESIKKELRIGI